MDRVCCAKTKREIPGDRDSSQDHLFPLFASSPLASFRVNAALEEPPCSAYIAIPSGDTGICSVIHFSFFSSPTFFLLFVRYLAFPAVGGFLRVFARCSRFSHHNEPFEIGFT